VLLGAVVGMNLPGWFGWDISGSGPAVGAALVLGLTGYILHGMWVGIGLGTVLASWVAMACWIAFRNGASWTWPELDANPTIVAYAQAMWSIVPPDVARILPYACATALITGIGLAIIWPRVSLILGWSMAGATLLTAMGLAAVDYYDPAWLAIVPSPMWAQLTLLTALVLIGAMVQWKLGPKPAISKAPRKKKSDHDLD
jgi:hypothetical protein